MIDRNIPARKLRAPSIRRLGVLIFAGTALAGCLFEESDAADFAGPDDERTKAMQIIVDNAQGFPWIEHIPEGGAGRMARSSIPAVVGDTVWNGYWSFRDFGNWSEWMLTGETRRVPVEGFPHRNTYRSIHRSNTPFGFREYVADHVRDTSRGYWYEWHEWTVRITTRTGLVWTQSSLNPSCSPTDTVCRGWVPDAGSRLEFPSLGLHVDLECKSSTCSDETRFPVQSAEGRVFGYVEIYDYNQSHSSLAAYRWYSASGVRLYPRRVPIPQNAQDSVGLRISSLRRDPADGSLVIVGRFYIPEEYGFVADSLTVRSSLNPGEVGGPVGPSWHDATGGRGFRSFSAGAPDRYFSLRVPRGDSSLCDSGWVQVSAVMHRRSTSGDQSFDRISSGGMRLPTWKVAKP